MNWGMSGVMARGSGLAWDLRRSQPYEAYSDMEFNPCRLAKTATAMIAM